ncbi:MAG: hypothetical protein H0T45_19060 [Pyrinomonadaceae bacterium]|nr:hypothetical protein [Pyrinomonadaceae bacterium]
MNSPDREIEIAAGRHEGDGVVSLCVFGGDLLALAVEGQGERAPTLLLTREQAISLHGALAELISLLPPAEEKMVEPAVAEFGAPPHQSPATEQTARGE